MTRGEVTDFGAVLRAIAECDGLGREVFLSRYGFARSKRYEVSHEGRRYDPAALVAVAHREQHGRVLEVAEVKGARRVLEDLGFEIVDLTPPWREDEMVLALDVYMRHRGERLGKQHADVRSLSDTLRRLAAAQSDTHRSTFRNLAGVEQQLGKFLDLDPLSNIEGRGQPSALHREIWERHAHDPLALMRQATEILNALDGIPRSGAPRIEPAAEVRESFTLPPKVPREALLAPFGREGPRGPNREAPLTRIDSRKQDRANAMHEIVRTSIAEFLRFHGFAVHNSAHREDGSEEILFDLAATRGALTLLIESKSLPHEQDDRDRLRLGLGQVLWYRGRWRRLSKDPCVAVLCVEHAPTRHQDWVDACGDVSVVLTWPSRFNLLIEDCLDMAARIRVGSNYSQ